MVLLFGFLGLCAQTQQDTQQAPSNSEQKKPDQNIPDAPSAVQPAKPLPENPAPMNAPPAEPGQNPPQQSAPAPQTPESVPSGTGVAPAPGQRPPINIKTVPEGGASKESTDDQEQFFKLSVVTNQVMVPVTVTDENGQLLNGLQPKDFVVLEDGKKQKLNFFTSDPFAISAAVVIDLGMKQVDLSKVQHTFPSLEGAFSAFDELSLYTYSNVVGQLTGWGAVGPALSAQLDELNNAEGQDNGPPVTSGPLAGQGPMINNIPVDRGTPRTFAAPMPARVLNDAILRAATDLTKRDPTRRKVIFVISDGREYRSEASYRDVLRYLLSNNIMVYAVGVGTPALPGYGTLSKLHLPRMGYGNILPKYVNATGGQVFNELTRTGIEDAYSQALGTARNQYTMGYLTHAAPVGGFRSIEVQVDRPSCASAIRPCVNVYARAGYYPSGVRQR